ncbi:hypothetical protein SynMVIR181_01912 [Synechococcus sp. MVIR-18-1]|nr:hypothetical protein SynMVIR181_01912 [Synechococcus sp. MVIR-18-1]
METANAIESESVSVNFKSDQKCFIHKRHLKDKAKATKGWTKAK